MTTPMRCSSMRPSARGSEPSSRGSRSHQPEQTQRRLGEIGGAAEASRRPPPDPQRGGSALDHAGPGAREPRPARAARPDPRAAGRVPAPPGGRGAARAHVPAVDDRDRPPREAADRHAGDASLGVAAAGRRGRGERRGQVLGPQHLHRVAAVERGRPPRAARRSRSTASAPTGCCSAATGPSA